MHISAPFDLLTGKFISGFESVYCYSDDHIFFGTEDGFAHYSPTSKFNYSPKFETYISKATALYLDSTFSDGSHKFENLKENNTAETPEHIEYRFPFKENSFRFTYTSPVFDNQDNIEYSFKLEGYNEKWSSWSNVSFNEYAKLPPGVS